MLFAPWAACGIPCRLREATGRINLRRREKFLEPEACKSNSDMRHTVTAAADLMMLTCLGYGPSNHEKREGRAELLGFSLGYQDGVLKVFSDTCLRNVTHK